MKVFLPDQFLSDGYSIPFRFNRNGNGGHTANDKFGWVGAQKATCILLKNFHWSNELIIWKDLLLLLEGDPVKLPALKNFFSEDV